MTSSKLGNTVPAGGEFSDLEKNLIATLQTRINNYIKFMEQMEFRKALAELRAVWVEGNNYITVAEPWTIIKEDEQRAKVILRTLFRDVCDIIAPALARVGRGAVPSSAH